jgi:hypothetical protein
MLVRMVCEAVDICSRGAEFGGHSFVTFRQKLTLESSHLSGHFYNSMRSAETLIDRKARLVAL